MISEVIHNMKRYEPTSRYDPTTMARVASPDDSEFDMDEEDEFKHNPEAMPLNSNDGPPSGQWRRVLTFAVILAVMTAVTVGICVGVLSSKSHTPGASNASLAEPPLDLGVTCSEGAMATASGFSTCESICAQAVCCVLPLSDPRSCATIHSDRCAIYERDCAILGSSATMEVPPAPADLSVICATSSLRYADGFTSCETACAKASCCSLPGSSSCYTSNSERCDSYDPCGTLTGTFKSHPMSVASLVKEACTTDNLFTKVGVLVCSDVCEHGFCCFAKKGETSVLSPLRGISLKDSPLPGVPSCQSKENNAWCMQYAPCASLEFIDQDGFDSHDEAKSTIDVICSERTDEGKQKCRDVCSPASCCFQGPGACAAQGLENIACDHYSGCNVLHTVIIDPTLLTDAPDHYHDVGDKADQEALTDISDQIVSACASEKLTNTVGRTACASLCQDMMCCFSDNVEINCAENHPEECPSYEACQNLIQALHEDDSEYKVPFFDEDDNKYQEAEIAKDTTIFKQVYATCQMNRLQTLSGFNACHDVCQVHLCCFSKNETENCYDDHPTECEVYSPCHSIVNGPPPGLGNEQASVANNNITSDMLIEACSSVSVATADGIQKCHSLCGPHMCCFVDANLKSNCVDTLSESECNDFKVCKILANGDTDPNDLVADSTVEKDPYVVCNEEDLQTDQGQKACTAACETATCCFAAGAGSCYSTDKLYCDGYKACEGLSGYNLGGGNDAGPVLANVASEVEAVCAKENLMIQDGRKACHGICDDYKCCFDKDVKLRCYDAKKESCDDYAACGVLFLYEDNGNFVDKDLDKPAVFGNDENDGGSEGDDKLKANVNQACSANSTIAKCQTACKDKLCCVETGTNSCYDKDPRGCDQYQGCSVLVENVR